MVSWIHTAVYFRLTISAYRRHTNTCKLTDMWITWQRIGLRRSALLWHSCPTLWRVRQRVPFSSFHYLRATPPPAAYAAMLRVTTTCLHGYAAIIIDSKLPPDMPHYLMTA